MLPDPFPEVHLQGPFWTYRDLFRWYSINGVNLLTPLSFFSSILFPFPQVWVKISYILQ